MGRRTWTSLKWQWSKKQGSAKNTIETTCRWFRIFSLHYNIHCSSLEIVLNGTSFIWIDPRRASDIIIEKRIAFEIPSVAAKKEKKHRHKKRKRATEQSQKLPPRQPEDTKELKANTETQMLVLRTFKGMTNPEDSYNTHLRVLSWCGLLYGSDSLPSMAFLALDGNIQL